MNETLKLKGSLILVNKKADGTVEVRRKDNLILNAGFDFVADAIGNPNREAVMGYIAVGSGNTAVSGSQTALVSELGRKSATYSHTKGTKTFAITTTFSKGEATGALVEAGVCNASSGGTFLDRVTFDVNNKGIDDEISVTFLFTMS